MTREEHVKKLYYCARSEELHTAAYWSSLFPHFPRLELAFVTASMDKYCRLLTTNNAYDKAASSLIWLPMAEAESDYLKIPPLDQQYGWNVYAVIPADAELHDVSQWRLP